MSHTDLQPEELTRAAEAAITHALTQTDPHAMLAVLAQAGLCGAMAAPEDGGLGLNTADVLPIVHTAGRLMLPLPLAEHLLLAHAFAHTPQAAAMSAGERLASIAWHGSMQEQRVRLDRGPADWVLVADGTHAVLLDVCDCAQTAQPTLDPDHPQVWILLDRAQVLARLDTRAWQSLQDKAHVLLAQTVHGAAQAALQAAADYTTTRVQFGRALSAKQAVRHHLARMCLVHEASGAAIRRTLQCNEFGAPRATRPALLSAITHAVFIIEKAIHLHGGMGFTWELPLHRYLRMVRKLDAAFGELAGDVGNAFIQSIQEAA